MRLHGMLILASIFAAPLARAQCTTCSPLSLPSGSLVGQDLEAARRSTWSVLAQATTGWVGFPHQVADNERITTRESARFDLFLTTAQVAALHRSGLGVDVVVPFGVLASRVGAERQQDGSLGDLETRARGTALLGRSVRLTGLAGAALPTGSYTERSGTGALGDASRALTIGRGVLWAIAEVEARWEPVRRLALTASAQGRVPFGQASDGFRWGPELRSSGEVEVRPVASLGLALGAEVALRGSGSIVDPFLGERIPSTNVGATIVSLTPAARLQTGRGVFLSVTGRIPVHQDLVGLQFRQGPGMFAGAGIVFAVAAEGLRRRRRPRASARYVVRAYGADWCDACKKLDPILESERARRSDVQIEHIDVTRWSEVELAERVPGAHALPIVEVLRDGALVARLEGEETFAFPSRLKESTE